MYVPKGSKLVEFKGSQKKVQAYDELDKTVFEGYLEVPTQGKATAILEYSVPSQLSNNYKLLVEKQPGTDNQKLKVEVDGKTKYDGILDVDKEMR